MTTGGQRNAKMLVAVVIGLAITAAASSRWKRAVGSRLSPAAVCALVWTAIWAIHWSQFFSYKSISHYAIALSAVPVVSLFCGERVGVRMFTPRGGLSDAAFDVRRLEKYAVWLCLVGLVAGLVVFVSSWMEFGPLWARDGATLKTARATEGVGAFNAGPLRFLLKYASLMFGAGWSGLFLVGLCNRQTNRRWHWALTYGLCGALLYDVGWASRAALYSSALALVAMSVLLPRAPTRVRRGFSRLFLRTLAGAGAVVGVMWLAAWTTRSSHAETERELGAVRVPLYLGHFVDYHVGTLVSFDETLINNQVTWGRMSFAGIEQWLRLLRVVPPSVAPPRELLDWERETARIADDDNWQRTLNTYSWLRYLHSDLGLAGLMLVPFCIGVVGAVCGSKWAMSGGRHLGAAVGLAVCMTIVMKSPTIFAFRDDAFVLCVAAMVVSVAGARAVRPSRLKGRASQWPGRLLHSRRATPMNAPPGTCGVDDPTHPLRPNLTKISRRTRGISKANL